MRYLLGIVMLLTFTSLQGPEERFNPLKADLILINGKIWTVNPRQPWAEAAAVIGDKIVAVGENQEIRSLAGDKTRLIDLKGKLAVPGFNDAHVHFMSGGFHLLGIDLREAKSEEGFAKKIKEKAESQPKGRWILGGDWDHEAWPGARLPAKELIDKYTPETPVFVNRLDGHMAMANSYALKLAGITKNTPDPPGGAIVRDPKTGEPTGVLKDAAMSLVYKIVPSPPEEDRLRAARAALAEARRLGITSVQDMSSPEDFATYQTLLKNGELTCRIHVFMPLPDWKKLADVGVKAGFGGDLLKIGGLKGFADGSLGSTTALFFEPYSDSPGTRGLPNAMMLPEGNMKRLISGADKAGLQVAVHAIGDRANRIILDVFREVVKGNGERDRRFRIEHAQHIHPDDFRKFAELNVIASMQPYHAIDDGRWAEKRIGRERCKTTYAFRTLLDHKVKLAFGSDWSVAPMSPILGIYAAVTRHTLDGKNPGGWFPEQKITVAESVEAYTLTSAYASFEENIKGSIEPGKLADIAVLSHDLFSIRPEEIQNAYVLYTVVGGKVVYKGRMKDEG